jgi:hemoglobin
MRLMRAVLTAAVALTSAGVAGLAGCEHIPWFDKKPAATTTKPVKPAAEKEPTRSLYDRLGGENAIRAVVDDFVPRAAADEKVNFTRKGVPGHEWQATPQNIEKLKTRLVQFIGVATGGPQKYEGQDMGTAHKGMKITDAEFDALANDLKLSLDKLNVPAREQKELLEIVGSTRGVIVDKP